MAIVWKSSLEIGVKEIDTQHKELVKRINDLLDACSAGKGKEEIGKTINFLQDYVITHFNAEEALQQKVNYPSYRAHKTLHENFKNDLAKFKNQFELEGPKVDLLIKINSSLVDWLIKHISVEDKAIANFINSKQ